MKKGLIYIFITALMFATLEPVSKLIASDIAPMSMTFMRFLIGSILLVPFSVHETKKKNIKLSPADYGIMALLGILCICVSMVLLQFAVLKADNPALVAIIFSCNSVITIILAALVLNDRITAKKIIALVCCLVGILICSIRNLSTPTGLLSVILAVLSAVTFSIYTVMSKKLMKKFTGIIQTGFSFLGGSIALLVILLIMGENVFSGVNASSFGYILYLGIAVTGIGYWAYFKALEKTSATAASLVFFVKPILTPFVSFFITGAKPSPEIFAGIVFVIVGSYLACYSENRTKSKSLNA